jgi:hypothetical protein
VRLKVVEFKSSGVKIVKTNKNVVRIQYKGTILEILLKIKILGFVPLLMIIVMTNPLIIKNISNPNEPNFAVV